MFSFTASSRLFSRGKALALLTAALLVGGLLSVGFASAASATTPTTFNLTVHASNGAPQSGIEVILYTYNSQYQDWEQATDSSGDSNPYDLDTNSNGLVSFPITAGAKYSAFVSPDLASSEGYGGYEIGKTTHVNPDFNGTTGASGTFFVAAAGTNTASVTLAAGVTVSGNIFGPDGTTPNSDAYDVTAYRKTVTTYGSVWVWVTEQGLNQGTDTSYSIDGLAPGNYAFQASQAVDGALAGNAFNDAASTADAAVPTIVGTGNTTQDVTFAPAVSISGSVDLNGFTNESDNSEVQVQASPVDAEGDDISGDGFPSYSTDADPSGNYVLPVASGNYKIQFVPQNDGADQDYFAGWYNNAASEDAASVVHATSDLTLATNTLGQGFGISGEVTIDGDANSNSDTSGFTATVTDQFGDSQGEQVTDGTYGFVGLAPGKYTVDVSDPSDTYPDTFYTGSATPLGATSSYAAATLTGNVTDFTDVNFEFKQSASLTISVTNANGTPATNLDVVAQPVKDGQVDYSASAAPLEFAEAVAGHSGTYELTQLQQGVSYAISFASSENPAVDLQYLGGSDVAGSSDLFTPEQASSTISASLRANTSSSLTGTVTSIANKAVANVYVQLLEFDGTNWVDEGVASQTNSKGAYSFTNLPTGSYRVQYTSVYENLPYLTTFSGGVSTLDAATSVYVSAGHPAVVNTHLLAAGAISGTVAGGATAGHIDIQPVTLAGTPGNLSYGSQDTGIEVSTSSTGKFTVSGLPSGYYALTYQDEDGVYGDSYADPATLPTSLIYHVTAGATTNAGTLTLPLASSQPTPVPVNAYLTGSTLADADGDILLTAANNGVAGADLTANGDGTFSGTAVPGNYTYTTQISDQGNPLTPLSTVTGSVNVLPDGSTDFAVDEQAVAPLAFSTPASVTGSDSAVGTTYAVEDVNVNRDGLTPTYQWFRGTLGGTSHAIFGATQGTYTSEGGDLGQGLFVRITDADGFPNYSIEETASEYAVAVTSVTESNDLFNTTLPTIDSSTGKVGVALHANAGQWHNITGARYHYGWSSNRNGTITPVGTDSPTYVPVVADAGNTISLEVNATKVGYATYGAFGASNTAQIAVLGTPTLKTAPKVTSKAGTGATAGDTIYTATSGTWSVAGVYSYQWFVDGTPVTGNGAVFTAVPGVNEDPTDGITVQVTDSPVGYTPTTSAAIVARLDSSHGSSHGDGPVVVDTSTPDAVDSTSTVPFGDILSAQVAGAIAYGDDGALATTFTYQWQRETGTVWSNIVGATKATYPVGTADAGHPLQVLVKYSSPTHAVASWGAMAAGTGALNQTLTTALPTIVVTGTGAAGTKLTATPPANWAGVTGVTDTYQWYVCADGPGCTDLSNFTVITGAKLATYTPTAAQNGDEIIVSVTGNKAGYATGVSPSHPVTVSNNVITVNTPVSLTGLVAGNAVFGVKLTAKPATMDVAGATVSYQWQINNDGSWVNAQGAATASTYTPILSDYELGVTGGLRLVETITKTGYDPTSSTSATVSLGRSTPVASVKPSITTATGTWTIKPGTWPTAGGVGTPSYQWYVDGQATSDTGTTVLKSGLSHAVYVVETWSGGAAYAPATTTVIAQKGTAIPAQGGMDIQGDPHFGEGAIGVPGDIEDYFDTPGNAADTATMTYQWYTGTTTATTAIAGAKSANYTPTAAYVGKKLFARLTLTSPYYATSTYTTPGVLFAAGNGFHGSPYLSFVTTPHPGATASVSFGAVPPAGTTHGYQWAYEAPGATSFTNIAGATKATYVITAAQLGGQLEATVSDILTGYLTVSDPTPAVTIVQPAVLAPITIPTVAGPAGATAAGTVLTVSPGSWNVTGTTFTYRWLRNGVALPGVTTATYTLTGEDSGDEIQAEVTGHAAGYSNAVATTNTVKATDGAAPKATVATKVTGTVAQGNTLTATAGTWSLDGLTFSYQWFEGSSLLTGAPIDGATSSTYVVGPSDIGAHLWVVVTATRDGYAAGTSTSLITAAVPGVI